jgi:hypothetical protein
MKTQEQALTELVHVAQILVNIIKLSMYVPGVCLIREDVTLGTIKAIADARVALASANFDDTLSTLLLDTVGQALKQSIQRQGDANTAAKLLDQRLQDYFGKGGLINPEMMEPEKVRDLLIDLHSFVRSFTPPTGT